jgi:hypothetical protein
VAVEVLAEEIRIQTDLVVAQAVVQHHIAALVEQAVQEILHLYLHRKETVAVVQLLVEEGFKEQVAAVLVQ